MVYLLDALVFVMLVAWSTLMIKRTISDNKKNNNNKTRVTWQRWRK